MKYGDNYLVGRRWKWQQALNGGRAARNDVVVVKALCVRHTTTVSTSVDLIQFSFQLPVVYYHQQRRYCGINHLAGPRGCGRQAPLLGDIEPVSVLSGLPSALNIF